MLDRRPPRPTPYKYLCNSALRLQRRSRDLLLGVVSPFVEFLDHFSIERRDVVRFAARHQSVIDHDFFVHPFSAGVLTSVFIAGQEVSVRPRTHAGIDQDPWRMTNCRDRFCPLQRNGG